MKSFAITEILLYNPTLKSSKKKPIESDIQEAKIIAYYPPQAPIQQKCNTVGMAEGVYEFNRSLLSQQQRQKNPKQLVIFMDNCCLVQKQFEQNTWVFLKLAYEHHEAHFTKYGEDEQNFYFDNVITEDLAFSVIDHFYLSFKTFYGPIGAFIFLNKTNDLQKILSQFLVSYDENNRLQQTRRLDISSYLLNSIRALPLDVNSTLKFNYFKNVLQSYDSNIAQIMVFSHSLLAFSSLPKQITAFFQSYFYGTGEPYRFQSHNFGKRLKLVPQLSQITPFNKYGTCFNSLSFGLGNNQSDSRLSVAPPAIRRTVSSPQKPSPDQDLLGLAQSQSLAFPEVYINKNGEQQKYIMTYFMQKKMLFITFYKSISTKERIIFQNRFYFDNISKFSHKINQILSGVLAQQDKYRFLYSNLNTFTGKMVVQKWSVFVPEMRYIWSIIEKKKQSQVATTIQNHWIYGIHRLNRVLVLMIPSEVPLHKLDDFADKMFKQYFFKAFM